MDIEHIIEKLKDRTPKPLDIRNRYSVLIPIINNKGRLEIIFELRSKDLTQQPGEISFPGGEVEGMESYRDAAIRETMEELNIGRENIEIIGELDYLVSHAGITIHCFVGTIEKIDIGEIEPSKDEVDHIFTVPLDFFLNTEPDKYQLELETVLNEEFPYNLIPNGKDYNWRSGKNIVMFYHYGGYIIWGFTAKMMNNFAHTIRDLI
ncbi:MAG: CoA pyrophosphatase [Tissierellaceae bacterium]